MSPTPPTPPPKRIKDLRLADISRLDIQDIQKLDYQGFLKDLSKRPDMAISILAPILAIFIRFNMFSKSQTGRKSLTADLIKMDEKIKIVDEYTNAQKELEQFFTTLPPKIAENEFVDKLTDFAVKRDVQIESFSPAKNQSDPIYDATTISLNVNTKTYENMWLFIHDIENSGFSIRINSWAGTMGPKAQNGSRRNIAPVNPAALGINVRLEIASVSFKK